MTNIPRYVKQRDRFRCGPLAILNVLKWAGEKQTSYWGNIKELTELCFCIPSRGTKHSNFEWVLRGISENLFKIRRVYHPKLSQIKRQLQKGGVVILNYQVSHDKKINEERRHFFLVTAVSSSGEHFDVVNAFTGPNSGPALQRITCNMFKFGFLRNRKSDRSFKGWFLTKLGENDG